MTDVPREPTSAECTAHAPVGGGFAGWYPQMGGYTSACVAVPSGSCWDVWVWHDGEFPFDSEDQGPVLIHHCDPFQFVSFGTWLIGLNGADRDDQAGDANRREFQAILNWPPSAERTEALAGWIRRQPEWTQETTTWPTSPHPASGAT